MTPEQIEKGVADMRKVLPSIVAAIEAAERKATVERIKDVILDPDGPPYLLQNRHAYIEVHGDLFALLDAEAAR